MAWNGSNTTTATSSAQRPVRRGHCPRPALRYALAGGLAIVVLGGVTAWLMSGRDGRSVPPPENEPKPQGAITEVAPAIVTNKTASLPAKRKGHRLKAYRYWEQDNTNGFTEAMQLKWQQVRRPRLDPVVMPEKKQRFEIFEHTSENVIACLLTLEPGKSLYGYPTYKGMEEDFLKSCEVPIVIRPEDDDYTKQLKKAMNETKIELRERMRNGETLEDIIKETCDEARKLAELKDFAESELSRLRREKASPEDLKDYIDAANQHLGEKGIAPIHVSPIIKQKIKHLMVEDKKEE